MPQYYKYKKSDDLLVEVRNKSFFRRGVFRRRPYYVGQQPFVNVKVVRLSASAPRFSDMWISQEMGGEEFVRSSEPLLEDVDDDAESLEFVSSGSFISKQGDYTLNLNYTIEVGKTRRVHALMTATIINPDIRDRDFILMLYSAIIGAIVAILLFLIFGIG